MRLVIVHWHDAGSGFTIEDAKSHFRQSVGFEVENVPGVGVVSAMESDCLSGVHWIPWGMVRKVEEITREAETP